MLIRPLTAIWGSAVLLLASQGLWAQEAPAKKRFEVSQSGVSRLQAVGLSLIFPGLGQLATGHKPKGTTLMVAEMGCLVIWLTSHEDFNTQEVQFELEKERYQALRRCRHFCPGRGELATTGGQERRSRPVPSVAPRLWRPELGDVQLQCAGCAVLRRCRARGGQNHPSGAHGRCQRPGYGLSGPFLTASL